jgi:hypothetical protein
MRITQIRDQLATIGEKLEDIELVNVALNGFSSHGNHLSRDMCSGETSQL